MSAPVLPDSFGFNTQPPEGGWLQTYLCRTHSHRFNTQPPEGGWSGFLAKAALIAMFQHTAA